MPIEKTGKSSNSSSSLSKSSSASLRVASNVPWSGKAGAGERGIGQNVKPDFY